MATSNPTTTGPELEETETTDTIPSAYTITFKPETTEEEFQNHITQRLNDICKEDTRTSGIEYGPKPYKHIYNFDDLKGYSGTFTPGIIKELKKEDKVECVSPNIHCRILPKEEVTEDFVDPAWAEVDYQPSGVLSDPYKSLYASSLPGSVTKPKQIPKAPDYPDFWNLGAISHSTGKGDSLACHARDARAGRGVDIYVIDTGIRISHTEFRITDDELEAGDDGFKFTAEDYTTTQGVKTRAIYGRNLVGQGNNNGAGTENADDVDGHGTMVAGVAGGKTAGVARRATLIAVKVMNNGEIGDPADVAAGIKWSTDNADKRKKELGRSAVFILSFGIHRDAEISRLVDEGNDKKKVTDAVENAAKILDAAVAKATKSGYLCCVAAGNSDVKAELFSPAREHASFIVGGVGKSNTNKLTRSPDSNYGSRVPIWAPGERIRTCVIGPNDTEMDYDRGTSLANPHVAGVAATILSRDNSLRPRNLRQMLTTQAKTNLIQGNNTRITHNRFLYNESGQ